MGYCGQKQQGVARIGGRVAQGPEVFVVKTAYAINRLGQGWIGYGYGKLVIECVRMCSLLRGLEVTFVR